jgi:hypothetical protein
MFSFFKKKSPEELLRARYEALMKEAFELSTINRRASDEKYAEADALMKELEALKKSGS